MHVGESLDCISWGRKTSSLALSPRQGIADQVRVQRAGWAPADILWQCAHCDLCLQVFSSMSSLPWGMTTWTVSQNKDFLLKWFLMDSLSQHYKTQKEEKLGSIARCSEPRHLETLLVCSLYSWPYLVNTCSQLK